MRLYISILSIILLIFNTIKITGQSEKIHPGGIWNDTEGNPINAHGGGVLFHDGTYYWFGEIKKGKTWKVEHITSWECYRVNAGGVSCYSSQNLIDWKNEGVALAPEQSDSSHNLHTSKVIERPKVIYNEMTKKFVMWLHVDSEDYSFSRAGVAISDNPAGPYTYLYSLRPNNQMSRDMTLFKDTNGKAYHVFSSENNAVMHVSLLTEDYLKPTGKETRIFVDDSREAPALFKHEGIYYLITSGCTGWSPNEAMLASANDILGEWEVLSNPFKGSDNETTFTSQSTFVLPVEGKKEAFVFMADRWNKTNLEDSRYIWLPIRMIKGEFEIRWYNSWNPDIFENE